MMYHILNEAVCNKDKSKRLILYVLISKSGPSKSKIKIHIFWRFSIQQNRRWIEYSILWGKNAKNSQNAQELQTSSISAVIALTFCISSILTLDINFYHFISPLSFIFWFLIRQLLLLINGIYLFLLMFGTPILHWE